MKHGNIGSLTTPPAPVVYASRAEVAQAISRLTSGDQKRLMVAALYWWKRFGLEYTALKPEDLLQEAVLRALKEEGARNWPKHISFVKFLSRGMESIAGHCREKIEAENVEVPPPLESSDTYSRLQAQKEVQKIREFFGEDTKAFDALVLKAQGLDAKEIMDELQLSATEWETIRKRIQRKLTKFVNINEEE